MLSIGDIFAGSSKAPPSATPPPERPGTTPSSSAATPAATPLPWCLGTMPSSLAITLTTAYGQEMPPAKGGAQRTTAQSTTYDAHRRLFSFSSSDSSARAARTISSTLDNLRLDITLQIHERICKFSLSLALLFLTQEPPRRTNAFGGKGEGEVVAQRQKKRWDENSPPPPYLRRRHCS